MDRRCDDVEEAGHGTSPLPGNSSQTVVEKVSEEKKRVVDRRSPEREEDQAQRRVKGKGESGALRDEGGLDEIEAALPEILDLSGRTGLTTAELMQFIRENPRASILKLDRCTVAVFSPCLHAVYYTCQDRLHALLCRPAQMQMFSCPSTCPHRFS